MSFASLASLLERPIIQTLMEHEREHEKEKETADWLSGKTGLFAVFAANLAASLAVYGIVNDRMKAIEGTQSTTNYAETGLLQKINDITEQFGAQVYSIEKQLGILQSEFDTTNPLKRYWNNSNQDDASSESSYDPENASSESSFDPENIHLPTETSEQQ